MQEQFYRYQCHHKIVPFADELKNYLPQDLPSRHRVVSLGARHLDLIHEINQVMNLTRIVDHREAAIKHICDSVIPWRLFEMSRHVVDGGTGAGFPGIPLAIVLPNVRFTLCESIQKKARFVATVIETLQLPNVQIEPVRLEDWLKLNRPDCITARAMAPLSKALPLIAHGVRNGAHALLYKGPDAETEIDEARKDPKAKRLQMTVKIRYELPENCGQRTVIEVRT